MNRRGSAARAVIVLTLAVLWSAAAPAAPESAPGGPESRGVALARRGLSLRNDSSILMLEPTTLERAPVGAASPGAKNPMVAVLMSIVLPGWGELYTGHTARAKAFMAAEASIWVGYAAFQIQGNLREDDYKQYAETFAGVTVDGDADYWDNVSDYIRSEGFASYNEYIRREARSLYPDDLDAQREYLAQHGYFGDLAWEWDNEERFREFRRIKHDAAVSFRSAFFMSGLAILNRAISAIDSAWMVRRYNQGLAGEPTVHLSVAPDISDGAPGGRAAIEITF